MTESDSNIKAICALSDHPRRKRIGAMIRVGIAIGIRPFLEQSLNEALGLAIGTGRNMTVLNAPQRKVVEAEHGRCMRLQAESMRDRAALNEARGAEIVK